MPLTRQMITFPFASGIDTKTDPNQVPLWKMSSLENVVFNKLRQLRKRNGYSALSNQVASSSGFVNVISSSALTSFKDELVMTGYSSNAPSKSRLYSYTDGAQAWIDKGSYTPCSVSSVQVSRGTSTKQSPNSACTPNGIEISVWEQGSDVYYSALDIVSGQVITPSSFLAANASKPRVISVGGNTVAYYLDSSSVLYGVPFVTSSTVSVGTPVQITASSAGSVNTIYQTPGKPNYDIDVLNFGFGDFVYLVFVNDAGGFTVRRYDPSLIFTLNAQQSLAGYSPDVITMCNFMSSNKLCIVFSIFGDQLRFCNVDHALTGSISSPASTSYSAPAGSSIKQIAAVGVENVPALYRMRVFVCVYDPATTRYFTDVIQTSGFIGASYVRVLNSYLASKCITYNNRAFAVLSGLSKTTGTTTPLQNQTIVVSDEVSFVDIVARAYYGSSSGIVVSSATGAPMLAAPQVYGESVVRVASLVTGTVLGPNGNVQTNTGLVSTVIDFASSPVSDNRSEIGSSLILGGGIVSQYDGSKVVELGFNTWPDEVTVSLAGGGSLSAGTYSWVACYEWTDQQGITHRSAPSLPATATATAGQSASVTVSNLVWTKKTAAYGRDDCQIVLYRTVANGTIYYRASSLTAPTLNNTTTISTTVSDLLSDADLSSRPQLYTTGGVVENIVSAPMQGLSVHRGRLFGIDSTNKLQLWYSKQVTVNAPVEFSDSLSMMIDNRGGDVTAIASLDDKLIVFKKNIIMMVSGQGPDSLGSQNDFSDAMLVTSDCGCIDAKSVVTVPDGLMFQSAKGIYLLDRSLKAQYIGAEVEAYNSDSVISAQLIPTANQVRFVLSSGIALVYDYYVQQWCVFTNHPAVDTVIWQDRFCWLRSNGVAMKEDFDRHDDDGSFVKMTATTSWIKFSTDAGQYLEATDKRMPMALQGFQRAYKVLILGQYINNHKLSVRISYDFQDAYTQETIVTPDTVESYGESSPYGQETPYGGDWKLYQWRIDLARQKCQAVKVTISDIEVASSDKESVRLSALTFDLGLKPGLNRVPMSNVLG